MKVRTLATLTVMLTMLTSTAMAEDITGKHYVKMSTNLGDFVLELDADAAPITVKNFLGYVEDGFYKDTIFHRIIKDFMIQGGGMTGEYVPSKTKAPIQNEADNGLPNSYGTIAMARTGNPHSATSQFFINTKDNAMLNHRDKGRGWGYCVFGAVVDGIETVEAIRNTPVHMNSKADPRQPAAADTPVVITDAKKLDPTKIPDIVAKAKTASKERDAKVAAALKAKAAALKAQKEREAESMAKIAPNIEIGKQLVAGKGVDISKGVATESGLWYVDSVEGDGAAPASSSSKVTVHYTGWFVDGKEFDSSRSRGTPASFPLNGVIKGWTEGVGSMKVGTRRYLVIPPDLAYGPNQSRSIPGNSVLVFDVELLEIAD